MLSAIRIVLALALLSGVQATQRELRGGSKKKGSGKEENTAFATIGNYPEDLLFGGCVTGTVTAKDLFGGKGGPFIITRFEPDSELPSNLRLTYPLPGIFLCPFIYYSHWQASGASIFPGFYTSRRRAKSPVPVSRRAPRAGSTFTREPSVRSLPTSLATSALGEQYIETGI
jgi:hypothetical protein